MKSVTLDHVASVAYRLGLKGRVNLADPGETKPGDVVAVRVLSVNPEYKQIECADETRLDLQPGMVIAGALGGRQALRGFVGYAPLRVHTGETLSILNLGGVIGRFLGGHIGLGEPSQAEVLGAITRRGRKLNLKDFAIAPYEGEIVPPVVLVLGTCMNTGKTSAARTLVQHFAREGLKVGAAKASGVACLKDLTQFKLAGAAETVSFVDCGYPSTVDAEDIGAIHETLVKHLGQAGCDVVVCEFGDGVLGHYGVESAMSNPFIRTSTAAIVVSASDPTGAFGAKELLERKGFAIDVVTGPATDSIAGVTIIQSNLDLPAVNALADSAGLYRIVKEAMCQSARPSLAPAVRSAAK